MEEKTPVAKKIRAKGNRKKWQQWEIEYILSHWPPVESLARLAARFDCSVNSVRYQARKLGLKRPQVNHEFFDSWSQDMAYVLGLTVTDGNVKKDGTAFSVELKVEDANVLEKVKAVMRFSGKLHETKPRGGLRLTGKLAGQVVRSTGSRKLVVGSRYIVKHLAALGVHPNKSLREVLPPVPKEFMKDFLRGFFDGDGGVADWIDERRKNKPTALVSYFCGNLYILCNIRGILYNELGVDGSISEGAVCEDGSMLHQLTYGKEDGLKVCSWLYSSPSNLFLDRKKKKYESFLRREAAEAPYRKQLRSRQAFEAKQANSRLRVARRDVKLERVRVFAVEHTVAECAEYMGTSYSSACSFLSKHGVRAKRLHGLKYTLTV